MPWETVDGGGGWENVEPAGSWETVAEPPKPTVKPLALEDTFLRTSSPNINPQGETYQKTAPLTAGGAWETVQDAIHKPAQGWDELVGAVYDENATQGPDDPGGRHPGAAGRALKKLMIASPLMIPVHLANLAKKAGVPGAGFAYGAQDEVMTAGTTLATDPSMALLPVHRAVALAFLPGVAKDLGTSAGELWSELEANGFQPTEELGRKLGKTATGAAFFALLSYGALKRHVAAPVEAQPTAKPNLNLNQTIPAELRGEPAVALQPERRSAERLSGLSASQYLTHFEALAPEAKAAELARIHQAAYVDPLTGLGNRSTWMEQLQAPDAPPIKVVWDFEGLGFANNELPGGHLVGDAILQAVGDGFRAVGLKKANRTGGDEFGSLALTPEEATTHIEGLQDHLGKASITVTDASGKTHTYKNLRIWGGFGDSVAAAEASLKQLKDTAIREGRRAPKGERPLSLVEVTPDLEGQPNRVGEGELPGAGRELGDGPPVVPERALGEIAAAGQEGALTIGRAVEKDLPTVRDPRYENLLANRRAALEPQGWWDSVKEHFSPETLKTYFLDRMAAGKNLASDAAVAVKGKAKLQAGGPPDIEVLGPLENLPARAPRRELFPFDTLKQDPSVLLDLATNTAARPAWLTETLHSIVKPVERTGIKADMKQWLDLTSWERRFPAAKGEIAKLEAKLPFAEEGARMRRAVGGKEAGLGRRREQLAIEGKIREAQGRKDFTLAKILKAHRDQIYRQRLGALPAKLSPARIEELVQAKRSSGYKDARESVGEGEQKLGHTYHQLRELIKNSRTLREFAESPLKPIKDRIELLQQQIDKGGMVPQNFTEAEVKGLLEKQRATLGPERMAAVEAAGRSIQAIPENLMKLQHKTGIISDAQYQAVKALGSGYVPMFRLQEALAQGTKGEWGTGNLLSLSERKFLMKFEGSKLDTMDPIQATYLVSLRAFSDLARQETANSLIAMHKQALAAGLDLGFKKLRSTDPHGPRPTITRFVKGKKETWSLPESMTPVVEALKEPGPSGLMLSVLEKSRGWLQAGAVGLSLPFTVRNLPRDFGRSVYMVGKYLAPESLPKGFGLRTTYALGKLVETMVGVLRKDPKIMKQYQDALWNRALGNTLSFEINNSMGSSAALEVPGFEREITGLRGIPKAVGKSIVRAMSAGARYSEVSSKLMGWRMLEEGMKKGREGIPTDPKKRAWIVQQMIGTPPSNVRGSFAREGNVFLMFGNVAAQGWRTSWERTLRDPKGTVGRTGIAAIGLGTALVAWNNQFTQPENPDHPEWDKIPPEMKRDNWLLLLPATNPVTGRHEFLKIAKPEFVKAFFNVIENVIWDFATKNKPDWAQVGVDAATELGNPLGFNVDVRHPGSTISAAAGKLNPALKAPLELAGNFQTFKGTPIESQQDLRVAPAERFDERTSPTAVVVGQATGTSPKKLEYLARTFGAGLADAMLSVTDLAARPFSPQAPPARPSPERIPILSSLVKTLWDYGFRDAERERNLQDYYIRKGEVDQALATYTRAKKNDKSTDRASQYLGGSSFQSLKAEADYLDQRGEQINDIYKKLRAAPTEAQALVLNQRLNQVLQKIQADVKRRAAVRAARALAGPPSVPPPTP